MKYTLKDYQSDAVADVLGLLGRARTVSKTADLVTSVGLTAPTGAGKTVMAAAIIEALFFGSEEFGFEPDPGAVVLWFSDDPSLNEQAKYRLWSSSEQLRHHLQTIEYPFPLEKLQARTVYFLNTSKLSRNSLLVRGWDDVPETFGTDNVEALLSRASGGEGSQRTIWDTLRNTIQDEDLTLYMVFDEAHRGVGKRPAEQPTIVLRLIEGHRDVPPMPIVLGISATVERFNKAMADAERDNKRVRLGTVDVDIFKVQESGLLKDQIVLDFPSESGDFNTVLLRRGVRKLRKMSTAWGRYCADQGEVPVVPLMVLQVPNKPRDEDVAAALDAIYEEWPDLEPSAIAHVFGDHATQRFGGHLVEYISPELVQDASYIRILLAKDAISTGWDCPRAEVMVSFRPAEDSTYITQLLGRMIRTPLARRIEGDDVLNSVECILPRFNITNANAVLERLHGAKDDDGTPTVTRVLIDPVTMGRNPSIPVEVWECVERVPTHTLPRRSANPITRLTTLAHALAADGLLPDAGKLAHKRLHGVLDGLIAQYKYEYAKAREDVLTVTGTTLVRLARSGMNQKGEFEEYADDRAVMDAYRAGARVVTPDIARTYVDNVGDEHGGDEEAYRDAHIRTAAVARLAKTRPALEREARELGDEWLTTYRVQIKQLPEARRTLYDEIWAMTTDPQTLEMVAPVQRQEETKAKEGDRIEVLDRRPRHLLADEELLYPIGKLLPDELEVLERELAREETLAWYRNPIGGRDSLGIAYRDRGIHWRLLRPDFVFFVDTPDGVKPAVVDPHGHHLPDAMWKLRGMAEFAKAHGGKFHRLEAISRIDGKLRVLDFAQANVRDGVLEESDARQAYQTWGMDYA